MKRYLLAFGLIVTWLLAGCGQSAPQDADAAATSIVDYVTPSQQEGPYYPVNKPADRDNDLTQLEGASAAPRGDILEFGGTVYDSAGQPLPGILIEIWQTDASGIYDHPGDSNTAQRDRNFQFYGEATTAADGSYSFRTIMPGRYEPRPRHIHIKVKDGAEQELLTTQFYFAGDRQAPGGSAAPLLIELNDAQRSDGTPILFGQRDIVLRR